MAGRVLLDTNAVIALLSDDQQLRVKIDDADEVFVSITVLGEFYYGAAKSTRVQENLAGIDRFAQTCPVLLCTGLAFIPESGIGTRRWCGRASHASGLETGCHA